MKKFSLIVLATLVTITKKQAVATKWGFCNSGLSYSDSVYTERKPIADAICALPDGRSASEVMIGATERCDNGQTINCSAEALAGIGAVPSDVGENDVPQGAWYATGGEVFPKVRCSCGCFTPDTNLLTASGWQRIDSLQENAFQMQDELLVPKFKTGIAFQKSSKLKPVNFTKGAELKPVIRVETENKYAVELTELHPVIVLVNGKQEMVQAKKLQIGDVVFGTGGEELKIASLTSRMLPAANNSVYNVNTMGFGGKEHVVVANGIRVGDLAWQNKLSERTQRAENLLKY
jgi:hypothetical protein